MLHFLCDMHEARGCAEIGNIVLDSSRQSYNRIFVSEVDPNSYLGLREGSWVDRSEYIQVEDR